MTILWTTLVMIVVIGTLAVAAWCLFEMSPYARHSDVYRDPTGKFIGKPPRLD